MSEHAFTIAAAITQLAAQIGKTGDLGASRMIASILAEAFCGLDDDAQAGFFIDVARIMGKWDNDTGSSRESQLWAVGRHLATCECSTPEAVELIETISAAATRDMSQND